VPGHGEIGDAGVIADARTYLELLRAESRRLAEEGASADETAEALDRSMRDLHPDWDQPEWIAFGARCFHDAHTRERRDAR